MITLDTTSRSLEVKLSANIITNQLPVVCSYVDVTTTTYVPGANTTQTNNGTAVTATAAPSASTQRQVKLLTVFNADTVAAVATVQYNDNTTLRILVKITLAVGDTLIYTDGEGWRVIDANGNIKTATGTTSMSATTIATGQVSVTSSNGQVVAARTGRYRVTIVNHGTTDVYLGVSGVSTSTGILLKGIAGAAVTLETSAAIYGIVASSTQTVSYLEEY